MKTLTCLYNFVFILLFIQVENAVNIARLITYFFQSENRTLLSEFSCDKPTN